MGDAGSAGPTYAATPLRFALPWGCLTVEMIRTSALIMHNWSSTVYAAEGWRLPQSLHSFAMTWLRHIFRYACFIVAEVHEKINLFLILPGMIFLVDFAAVL